MTVATDASPLSQMILNKAFAKFDRDGDSKLKRGKLDYFDQTLRPGVALDDTGRPTVEMKQKLDHNGDGAVDLDEMNSTGILMPASMCDTDFSSLLGYLCAKVDDPAALQAAAILELNDNNEA